MPTITQLPTSNTTTAADIVPVSQNGSTCAVSLGTLLAGTQPAIQIDTQTLLGRVSVGSGGPEQVDIGLGLTLLGGTLVASGTDHTSFPSQLLPQTTDKIVLSTDRGPALLPVSALRSLFQAGSNISITPTGIISAVGSEGGVAGTDISQLTTLTSVAMSDLVAVSHGGATYSTTIETLIDGVTISQIAPAQPPADTDTFFVAQNSDTLVRQNVGGMASWLTQRVRSSAPDVVALSTDTTLDLQLHNGRILVCTAGIKLAAPSSIASSFRCEIINVSASSVSLPAAIISSSGAQTLPAGQGMLLYCLQYNGRTLIYAWTSSAPTSSSSTTVPGQPTLISANVTSANSVQLVWMPPQSNNPSSYVVSYRQSGTTTWSTLSAGSGVTQLAVTNLAGGCSYEFGISACFGTTTGSISNLLTVTLSVGLNAVTSPTTLSASNITPSAATLNWGPPTTGQAQMYVVEYRMSGANTWSGFNISGNVLTANLASLAAAQAYDWRVTASDTAGNRAVSTNNSFVTASALPAVTSISWNVVPAGPFSKGTGAIGVNAHVTPATASVQFGLSLSSTVQPSSWTGATYVNNDLWGAYLTTPATSGTYFLWAQGMDGSCVTVSTQTIVVS